LKRFELIRRMHVLARDILVKADFVRIVRGVDDTADRFSLLDLLALDAQQLCQPAAFANGDEIATCYLAIPITLRFHHKVLQHPFRGDTRR